MRLAQSRAFQSVLRAIDGQHVVDQDVGAVEQLVQAAAVCGGGEIERYAQLAGVEVDEHAAVFRVPRPGAKRTARRA